VRVFCVKQKNMKLSELFKRPFPQTKEKAEGYSPKQGEGGKALLIHYSLHSLWKSAKAAVHCSLKALA
jgi:hypothetical protein